MSRSLCPGCEAGRMAIFLETPPAPVLCTLLSPTREAAAGVPRGPMRWGACTDCGLISNVAFDECLLRYSGAYENSLHFSPRYQQYAEQCAAELVERYQLRGKDIVEIGCGQADFLAMLCRLGGNRGVGFDPSYDPQKAATVTSPDVRVVAEFYSEAHADQPADLICSRHVLEHIPRPMAFLRGLRRTVGQRTDTVIFFEVPNGLHTLRRASPWDLIYEHCSYFTPAALSRVFAAAGFEPLKVRETFEGQFLTIEARPRADAEAIPDGGDLDDEMRRLLFRFPGRYQAQIDLWRRTIADIGRRQRRAVIWGAGSKAVCFVNAVGVSPEVVPYAVDLNPRKHGQYLTGTGQKIVAPAALREYRPDVILIMNPIYRDEIAQMAGELGLNAELLIVQ